MGIENRVDSVIYNTADRLLGGPDNRLGGEIGLARMRDMTICIIIAEGGHVSLGVNLPPPGEYQPTVGRQNAYRSALHHLRQYYPDE